MSIRQQIITAIDTRLRTITVANSYTTNAGAHVYDWLDRDLADTELDAIIYRDRSDVIEHNLTDAFTHRLRVEIDARSKNAASTAAQIRKIIDDIYKAIGVDDTWGGLAQDTSMPTNVEMAIEQADKIMGGASFTIEIEYDAAKWTQ
ncbi:hypothetical protein M0R72_14045 [Candidatus Pacearchaeota archaeon]|jgi:hypothetical protein|nr:hypothetical protein [Candidatus Pacearchaeota archaeon]